MLLTFPIQRLCPPATTPTLHPNTHIGSNFSYTQLWQFAWRFLRNFNIFFKNLNNSIFSPVIIWFDWLRVSFPYPNNAIFPNLTLLLTGINNIYVYLTYLGKHYKESTYYRRPGMLVDTQYLNQDITWYSF